MPKENTVLTIDVGGDSLKMAEFVFPPGRSSPCSGSSHFASLRSRRGTIPLFAQAYNEMTRTQFHGRQVRLSLSGQSSFSALSKLPSLLGNKSAIARVVEYEARQTVPYAMSEVVWVTS